MRKTSRLIETLARESVVLHLDGDESLKGILYEVYEDSVVLRHAASLWDGGETKVDGDAIVPRQRILWLQRLGEAEVTP